MDDDPELFVRNADMCLRWARTARDEEAREAFVNLARTWLVADVTKRAAPQQGPPAKSP